MCHSQARQSLLLAGWIWAGADSLPAPVGSHSNPAVPDSVKATNPRPCHDSLLNWVELQHCSDTGAHVASQAKGAGANVGYNQVWKDGQ
jgi:hypothetical protein